MMSRTFASLFAVVAVSSLAPAHSQTADARVTKALESDAVERKGLKFDANVARDFESVNPAVATALLSLRDRAIYREINLLRGAMVFPGVPTIETFELVSSWPTPQDGDERLRAQASSTFTPLPQGRLLQVRWEAVERDAETLQFTFYTEIIDEALRVYQRTNPNAVLLTAKNTREVLSLSEQ